MSTNAKTPANQPQQKTTAGAEGKPQALFVVGACPVLHDHLVYQPGEKLELTEAQAARLGDKVGPAQATH